MDWRRGNPLEADLPAHHEVGDVMLGYPGRLPRGDDARVPHHRDPVRDPLHFLQLVGDEDDRLPVVLQLLQRHEKLLRLLRGQDGGWLIQDQELRIAVQGLEDFHALAHADGQVLDLPIRRERPGRTRGKPSP